jgi:hypothetical protein
MAVAAERSRGSGRGHLAVFVHELVERLDLRQLWLYAYALGVTSSRRLERRLHEDLGSAC